MNGGIYSREKMRNLKTYRMFESSVELSPEQIEWLDNCTKGTWKMNPTTGLVDVDGNFNCDGQGLSDFKGVSFGVVRGFFYCHDNQLTTLEGSPQDVVKGFYCRGNQLTTLEGAPQKVGWGFYCSYNQLTTLEGAPREVGGDFYCSSNQLSSLEGAPQKVGGGFDCGDNPVSEKTLRSIFRITETGKGYLESVEYLWSEIPVEDQILLYRPEFEWVVDDEKRKLDALRAYQGFKGMI